MGLPRRSIREAKPKVSEPARAGFLLRLPSYRGPEAVPKRASLASPSIGCRAPLVWLQRISLRNAKADAKREMGIEEKREMRVEEKRGEYV